MTREQKLFEQVVQIERELTECQKLYSKVLESNYHLSKQVTDLLQKVRKLEDLKIKS